MSEQTKIEWADATWNPWIGCTKVSPGCANCYAEMTTLARRERSHGRELWGKGRPRHRTSEAYWKQPLKWDKQAKLNEDCSPAMIKLVGKKGKPPRPRIFPSLCDWLDPEVPIEWLSDFLKLIRDTPNLDWLLLTKRPELYFPRTRAALETCSGWDKESASQAIYSPTNVWIGASVEDQQRADERIPELLSIPARVRFLSCEPLLGPIDLGLLRGCRGCNHPGNIISTLEACSYCGGTGHEPAGIHWVITGGESGPKARPCSVEWVRSLVRQCREAGVAPFVKQLGSHVVDDGVASAAQFSDSECWPEGTKTVDGELRVLLKHPKGGYPAEWPSDLRVRQYPTP